MHIDKFKEIQTQEDVLNFCQYLLTSEQLSVVSSIDKWRFVKWAIANGWQAGYFEVYKKTDESTVVFSLASDTCKLCRDVQSSCSKCELLKTIGTTCNKGWRAWVESGNPDLMIQLLFNSYAVLLNGKDNEERTNR